MKKLKWTDWLLLVLSVAGIVYIIRKLFKK